MIVVRSIQQQLTNTLKTINEMDGDLTRRLDVPGSDELSALNRAYNQAIENIQHIVQEIKSGALILSNASSDITDGNQDLAQRTDEQAASIVETAASMEQISTAISQTALTPARRSANPVMANDVMDATRVSNRPARAWRLSVRSASSDMPANVIAFDTFSTKGSASQGYNYAFAAESACRYVLGKGHRVFAR
jgi:methyl-accepting chemotaxis protein